MRWAELFGPRAMSPGDVERQDDKGLSRSPLVCFLRLKELTEGSRFPTNSNLLKFDRTGGDWRCRPVVARASMNWGEAFRLGQAPETPSSGEGQTHAPSKTKPTTYDPGSRPVTRPPIVHLEPLCIFVVERRRAGARAGPVFTSSRDMFSSTWRSNQSIAFYCEWGNQQALSKPHKLRVSRAPCAGARRRPRRHEWARPPFFR